MRLYALNRRFSCKDAHSHGAGAEIRAEDARGLAPLGQGARRSAIRLCQVGAPSTARGLADVTAALLARRDHLDGQRMGTFHCVHAGETSWHQYAQFVIGEALARGQVLRAHPDRVLPIPASAYPTPAKRPQNSRMDPSHIQRTFGLHLPHWQQGVSHILQQIL